MDNKLYFATFINSGGGHTFCTKETTTGLCDESHDHVYHVEDSSSSEVDPEVQKLLASRHSRQQGESLPQEEEPYGPDHIAPVTPIWDARSMRGRQFPPV